MPGENQLLEEGYVANGKWEVIEPLAKGLNNYKEIKAAAGEKPFYNIE